MTGVSGGWYIIYMPHLIVGLENIREELGCSVVTARAVQVLLRKRLALAYSEWELKTKASLKKRYKVLNDEQAAFARNKPLYMQAAAAEIYTMIQTMNFSEMKYGIGALGMKIQILEAIKKYEHGHA